MIKKITNFVFVGKKYPQIPLPKKIADKLEIKKGDCAEWTYNDGKLSIEIIKKVVIKNGKKKNE